MFAKNQTPHITEARRRRGDDVGVFYSHSKDSARSHQAKKGVLSFSTHGSSSIFVYHGTSQVKWNPLCVFVYIKLDLNYLRSCEYQTILALS